MPVTLTRYNGLIHDYGLLRPIAHVQAVQTAVLQAVFLLSWFFRNIDSVLCGIRVGGDFR